MTTRYRTAMGFFFLAALTACSDGSDSSRSMTGPANYDAPGPYPVANRTIRVTNHRDGRVLDVELWYPADSRGQGQFIEDFAIDDAQRAELSGLIADNPDNCVTRETSSADALAPTNSIDRFPLVAFSHCFECTRFSSFSLAERLASHGFAVAAPDHAMNTLFDSGALLSAEFLAIRANDISAVVDELLIPNSAALPEDLQGRFDATRIGMAGHSYGAITTGKVLQDDDRFQAGYVIAAPVENPLVPGVEVARIEEPTLFMVAREDNSITEIGNALLRANFDAAASPSWKVEIADAGHWSVSDIAGITPAFQPGCGDGERQTIPGEPFTYIDIATGLQITASYGVRFFAGHLLGDERALSELGESTNPDIVDVQVK
ncbi:MAG: alpha/beta hydrolase family protein [Halioglobus sp.]